MGSLMFGASLPVFARDRQLKMRDEAAAMKAMAQADLAAMRAETRGKIGEAYAALTARTQSGAALSHDRAPAGRSDRRVGARGVSRWERRLHDAARRPDDRQQIPPGALRARGRKGKAWAELEMLTGRALIDSNTTRRRGSRHVDREAR